jgi:hypothetical protein
VLRGVGSPPSPCLSPRLGNLRTGARRRTMTRAFYQKTLEIFDSLVLRQRVIVGRSAVFCDFPESQLRRPLPPNNPHATRRKVTRSYRMDTGRSAAGNQRRQTQSQSVALAAIDPELLNSASPGREVDNGFNFQQPVAPSTTGSSTTRRSMALLRVSTTLRTSATSSWRRLSTSVTTTRTSISTSAFIMVNISLRSSTTTSNSTPILMGLEALRVLATHQSPTMQLMKLTVCIKLSHLTENRTLTSTRRCS